MHSGITCAIIFAIAAIIMSICSLAGSNPRTLGFDYLGIIVGILALLVTFLVGWQIAQTLISREQLRNLDAKIETSTKHNLHINLYHVFLFQGINAQNRKDNTSAIDYYIRSLDSATKCCLDYSKIDDVIQRIKSITHNMDLGSLQINTKDYHVYEQIIKSSKHDDCGTIIAKLKEHRNDNVQSYVSSWANLDYKNNDTGLLWRN